MFGALFRRRPESQSIGSVRYGLLDPVERRLHGPVVAAQHAPVAARMLPCRQERRQRHGFRHGKRHVETRTLLVITQAISTQPDVHPEHMALKDRLERTRGDLLPRLQPEPSPRAASLSQTVRGPVLASLNLSASPSTSDHFNFRISPFRQPVRRSRRRAAAWSGRSASWWSRTRPSRQYSSAVNTFPGSRALVRTRVVAYVTIASASSGPIERP